MNILLIQILRLGDALQLTPVATALKTRYPDARICVATSSLGKIIFERQKCIDEIFVIRKEHIAGLVKKSGLQSINTSLGSLNMDLEPILSQKWDWVINLNFSFASALLAFLAHGEKYSGFYATKNREYLSKEKWFSYSLASFPNRKYSNFNWVDINNNIVNAHGVSKATAFPVSDEESGWADTQIRHFNSGHEYLIGIHPGASGDYKMWPIDNFIRLAQGLVSKGDRKVVVFGDQNELELGRRIEAALGKDILNLTGKTTLGQTAAMMSRCSLLVCNDSGPMHLAAAVGTPVIALFFSTHFVETGPYGEKHLTAHPMIDCFPCQGTVSCVHKRCRETLPVEAVSELINQHQDIQLNNGLPSGGFPPNIAFNISRFDPWGFLEWVPAVKRPMDPTSFIRLILKLSFLPTLTGRDKIDTAGYAVDYLNFFSFPDGKAAFQERHETFLQSVNNLHGLFKNSFEICMQLYNQSFYIRRNMQSIQQLGARLNVIEEALSKHSAQELDIVIKFIEMERNNITERDFHLLASQNVMIYKEGMRILENMKQNTLMIFDLLRRIDK
jgi:lipopolysaccharide heptosyltransferase II